MQIVNMVLDKGVAHFLLHMKDELTADNPIQADVVKKGLLQTDKTTSNIQIGISGGDHDLPEDQDGIVTLEKLPKIGIVIPAREVGGGQIWMRRGIVRLECFFINEKFNEDRAHEVAYDALGRCMELVETMPITGLVDDFGERVATPAYCYANSYFESGGPPNQYIFRGKINWAFFSERP